MERLKRGILFWVLLAVTVALPASAQQTVKKHLYHATVKDSAGSALGPGQILTPNRSSLPPSYMVRSLVQGVTKVSLQRDDVPWPAGSIILCENGNPAAGDCTYDADGRLDIEGAIVPAMFPTGLNGGALITALQSGHLLLVFNDGWGTGLFYLVM